VRQHSTDVFASLGTGALPGLWDAPGKPSLKEITRILEFTKKAVAQGARIPESKFSLAHGLPIELEDRLREWAMIIEIVAQHFDGDSERTALWFRLPNPLLGGFEPREMIRFGRANQLRRVVTDAVEGNLP
jgi:hypothetical protein